MTTSRPAARARSAASSSITPSCIQTAFAPIAIASSTCAPAWSERRKMSTTSTGSPIARTSGSAPPALGGAPEDVAHADGLADRAHMGQRARRMRVDAPDALAEALLEEVGDAVRVAQRVRRPSDDGPAVVGGEHVLRAILHRE